MEKGENTNSMTKDQKVKICNSLLHRIRIIQGHTNLNYSDPHFVESKDSVRQTKDIIHNINDGLRKGCSDVIKSAREQTRFSSETNSSLIGQEKPVKKRQLKNLTGNNRPDSREKDAKIDEKQMKDSIQNVDPFCEGGEKREHASCARLSQIISKENDKEMQIISNLVAEGKMMKKKKRRKRKRDEIEVTSSMTVAQSRADLQNFTHGDSRPPTRLKPRKNRERYTNRKKLECSGDESDIEDLSSRISDVSEAKLNNSRRKLRVNRSYIRASSSKLIPRDRDITEMVSSTIEKLNFVNNHVQKVIEESLSSGPSEKPSLIFEKLAMPSPRMDLLKNISRTCSVKSSGSSSNWSTASMSKVTLIDLSEINKSLNQQTQAANKKHSPNQSTTVNTPTRNEEISFPRPPPSTVSDAVRPAPQEVVPPKPIRKKAKNVQRKVEKETVEVTTQKVAPKKKKKVQDANSAEPVSSMKKTGKKKKEHVNFVTTPPEVVPDYHCKQLTPIPSKKSVKGINTKQEDDQKQRKNSPKQEDNRKQQKNSPKLTPTENIIASMLKKPITKPNRRVSSAKTYRQVATKELPRVKSTGNLDSKHKDGPLTVRSVLEEEANNERRRSNSKTRKRSGSREETRSRSQSGSRDGKRPRSKSGSRNDEILKSKDVREIYYKIRANTTNTIANINQQMSSTLKESIAHLNEICGKVRNTLTDMEKDEQTYKRLKSKKSFEVSSEGGGSTISVQTNKVSETNAPGKSGDKPILKSHTYTVITQPRQDTSIGQLMNTISMAGDNLLVNETKSQVTSKTSGKEKKKRKTREQKKRPSTSKQVIKPKASIVCSSKTKLASVKKAISNEKISATKIPIWQRKPPSVIEEIQLTVKKQATKSQYRDFLRALKSIARKQRSQVHVVPPEFKEIMEKQQEKAFDAISKHKLIARKRKDGKPVVEIQANRACKVCPPDKCTCGVTVENTITPGMHKNNWMHVRSDSFRRGIQVYDILDEITLKDVEPIQSEYPRKDHISDADANKRIEDTLLYKLLYHEDPKVLESLLKSSSPPVEEQKPPPKLSNAKVQERPKSVSDAYRLYEQLEFNADKKPSLNLTPTKASICLKASDNVKIKDKPKALDMCTKEFNDELIIPADLKPTLKNHINSAKKSCKRRYCQIKLKSNDEIASIRSRRRIEDKLKVIGKTSSIKSIDRRNRKSRFSKENIKTKLKNYNDSKYKIKKMLTVMPISIIRNKDKKKKTKLIDMKKTEDDRQVVSDLKISDENRIKISNMSKREIIQILKPYIFFDLQPPVITVMPVYPKYNHQSKHQKQDHNVHLNRGPTYKKVANYLKDHDDDCHTGKKLCRRCQMLMQSGDETSKKNDTGAPKKNEPLSQKQLWKNKYKPTPAEHLVNRILGKKTYRKKFQAVPPDEKNKNKDTITMTPRELNRNAANTRSKLNEVRNIMEEHKPLLGQHLDDIIDALEFRIVDALSNPKSQHTDAFNEIEFEIKNILSTISELRELNQENIRANNVKLKSKTDTDLEDSSALSNMKSNTDSNLIDSKSKLIEDDIAAIIEEENNTPIIHGKPEVIIEEDEKAFEEIEEEKKLDETYSNLGRDIEKVIEDLDAIMNIDEEPESEIQEKMEEEIQMEKEEKVENVVELKQNDLTECENAIVTFCEQMDEVMKNMGTTDELNTSTDTLDAFVDNYDIRERKSDEYLTPFMKAVKTYRRSEQSQNFLEFLDKLTMLSRETVFLTVYLRMPTYKVTIQLTTQVIEVAIIYNQAEIESDEVGVDKIIKAEDYFYETTVTVENLIASDETPLEQTQSNDVLSTNQWMQTEETAVYEEYEEAQDQLQTEEAKYYEEYEEVRDQLIQTSSTEAEFPEIEEYLDSLENVPITQKTMLISEKNTQVPSNIDHSCFVQISSKDIQVTSDLQEMTSTEVGNQTSRNDVEKLRRTPNSATCQVSAIFNINELAEQTKHDIEKITIIDMTKIEKFTNRMNSCFDGDISAISFNEYPRTAYTDTYVPRERNSLTTDLQLCARANSFPTTTKKSSNIISIFESHKSSNDTNCTRDFLADGFGNNCDDSYDSMLVGCASSELDNKTPPSVQIDKERSKIFTSNLESSQDSNIITVKLAGSVNEEDKRHKHLLHSVYGIVFVLMFLSINLNYSCSI